MAATTYFVPQAPSRGERLLFHGLWTCLRIFREISCAHFPGNWRTNIGESFRQIFATFFAHVGEMLCKNRGVLRGAVKVAATAEAHAILVRSGLGHQHTCFLRSPAPRRKTLDGTQKLTHLVVSKSEGKELGPLHLEVLKRTKFRTDFPFLSKEKTTRIQNKEGFIRTPPNRHGLSSSLSNYQESPQQTKPKKGPKRKVHEFRPFFVNSGVFP